MQILAWTLLKYGFWPLDFLVLFFDSLGNFIYNSLVSFLLDLLGISFMILWFHLLNHSFLILWKFCSWFLILRFYFYLIFWRILLIILWWFLILRFYFYLIFSEFYSWFFSESFLILWFHSYLILWEISLIIHFQTPAYLGFKFLTVTKEIGLYIS